MLLVVLTLVSLISLLILYGQGMIATEKMIQANQIAQLKAKKSMFQFKKYLFTHWSSVKEKTCETEIHGDSWYLNHSSAWWKALRVCQKSHAAEVYEYLYYQLKDKNFLEDRIYVHQNHMPAHLLVLNYVNGLDEGAVLLSGE